MTTEKERRLWKFVEFSDAWRNADTSMIDEISPSWVERRKTLQDNSVEYEEFIEKLKREHAIETGIVERMYTLDRGVTETLINAGFIESALSHNDTNIPKSQLFAHLHDHLDAVDFVFDVVKEQRPLTTSFINQLHALVTQHQNSTKGRDQFGNTVDIPLGRGVYKARENNPKRDDGTVVKYCPPEHVASEMDNLVNIFNEVVAENVHPIIIAAWLHHSFTTIHPYEDGNGRVARLLASLILIKYGLFPFTVSREDAKLRYFDALELADIGNPQPIVDYFCDVERRKIEEALNLREVKSSSFEDVANILSMKLGNWKQQQREHERVILERNRDAIFNVSLDYLEKAKSLLRQKLGDDVQIAIHSCPPSQEETQHFYTGQILNYANQHNYYVNLKLPRAWITFWIKLAEDRIYQLALTMHHYGYDDTTMAIGAFLEFLGGEQRRQRERVVAALPLEIEPHVISISQEAPLGEKNIITFLGNALTLTIAQIASEL